MYDRIAVRTRTAIKRQDLQIDTGGWMPFQLGKLFTIKKGRGLTREEQIPGGTPYISATDSNNGVSARIGQEPIHRGNAITVSCNGSIGEAFYQEKAFWASGDINVLYPNFELNKYIALFICTIMRLEKSHYSYGRKWGMEKMKATEIKLPATRDGTPDWEFMESYIKKLPYSDLI